MGDGRQSAASAGPRAKVNIGANRPDDVCDAGNMLRLPGESVTLAHVACISTTASPAPILANDIDVWRAYAARM
jgi:hypothetical protein